MTTSATAATAWFDLRIDPAGTFEVFLEARAGANFGIASYVIPLDGGITSLDHLSPFTLAASGSDGHGSAGFNFLRSANDSLFVHASQDTITPTPHLVRGFGQTAGSFAAHGLTPVASATQPEWGNVLRVASGTWSGIEPSILQSNISYGVNVFNRASGIHTESASVATRINGSIVPPPALLAPPSTPVPAPPQPRPLPPPRPRPGLVPSLSEATVQVDLRIDPTGTFEVFLEASAGANFGIASYGIPLDGGITSLDHLSPFTLAASGSDGHGSAGFNFLRSANDSLFVHASQDTITPTPHLVRGFGQTAGSFAAHGLTPVASATQPEWGNGLRVASGTWSGIEPSILQSNISYGVNVFNGASGIHTESASVATRINGSIVPPPALFKPPSTSGPAPPPPRPRPQPLPGWAPSFSEATVEVDLRIDPAGTFQVFLDASQGDNFGIASFGISLGGGIVSLDHLSPMAASATGGDGEGSAGFTLLRSSKNEFSITGSQDTISPTPNLIRGFGQQAGSFGASEMTDLLGTEQTEWDASLLVASGTWTEVEPTLLLQASVFAANVFREESGIATMAANLVARINGDILLPPARPEPEPITLPIVPPPNPPTVEPSTPDPIAVHPPLVIDPPAPGPASTEPPPADADEPARDDLTIDPGTIVIGYDPDGRFLPVEWIAYPGIIDVGEWVPIAGAHRFVVGGSMVAWDADSAPLLYTAFAHSGITDFTVNDGLTSAELLGTADRQVPEPAAIIQLLLAVVGAGAIWRGRLLRAT